MTVEDELTAAKTEITRLRAEVEGLRGSRRAHRTCSHLMDDRRVLHFAHDISDMRERLRSTDLSFKSFKVEFCHRCGGWWTDEWLGKVDADRVQRTIEAALLKNEEKS